jgi:hypothetical protein
MGAIGWSEYDYFTAEPYSVFSAIEGYYDNLNEVARVNRVLSYRIHQSLVKKPINITEYMPLFGDNVQAKGKMVMDKETYELIKRKHGLK